MYFFVEKFNFAVRYINNVLLVVYQLNYERQFINNIIRY